MNYELAFIIPVYNTDVTMLKRCIESTQNIKDIKFEIVVVDDGSSEANAEEYQKLVEMYSDCFLFRKENGGVSSARNYGINHAEAKYVYFVDSDDEIEPKVFGKDMLKGGYDICFSDISVMNNDKAELWKAFPQEGAIYVTDVLKRMSVDGKINGPYAKIINCDFLKQNNICFPEDMIHAEDGMFLVKMLNCEPKMYYANINSYYYYKANETGQNRIINHTDVVIEGVKQFHEKINETVLRFVANENKSEILCNEKKKYIKGLFNIAAELALVHRLKGNNINKISGAATTSDASVLEKLDGVNRGRYILLKNKSYALIYMYGCIRKVYLTVKGN